MMEQGCAHVYTGDGKGKTTAMLGLALRAYGAGLKVYIGQFIKSMEYHEIKAIRECLPGMVIETYGAGCFIMREPAQEDIDAARRGFEKITAAVFSGEYDVVMLDEINVATDLKLIDAREVAELIRCRPPRVELVLTGRNAAQEVKDAADLVSEMLEIKHYYHNGVKARDGIER